MRARTSGMTVSNARIKRRIFLFSFVRSFSVAVFQLGPTVVRLHRVTVDAVVPVGAISGDKRSLWNHAHVSRRV